MHVRQQRDPVPHRDRDILIAPHPVLRTGQIPVAPARRLRAVELTLTRVHTRGFGHTATPILPVGQRHNAAEAYAPPNASTRPIWLIGLSLTGPDGLLKYMVGKYHLMPPEFESGAGPFV